MSSNEGPPRRIRTEGSAETIARYRLALVREGDDPYPDEVRCTGPAIVARFLHQLLEDEPREVFGAIFLDARNRAIGHTLAYAGTVRKAIVEPRGVFVPALFANASALIIFHNHASGDPSPSREDRAVTRQFVAAGNLLGVRVLDHIIVGTATAYRSLKEMGLWEERPDVLLEDAVCDLRALTVRCRTPANVVRERSRRHRRRARFALGRIVATPGALRALAESEQQAHEFLARHLSGDWGELCDEDGAANERALQHGGRLLSAYFTRNGVKLWVITEADRSSTCLLLPEEY